MYQSRLVLLAAGVVLAISMASVAGAASSNVVIVDPGVNATPADVDSQHNLQTKTCDPTTGTHCAAIDSNGSQQVKICDTTTSGQCATVTSNHDIDVKVDDNGSLIQLQDGSGTPSNHAAINGDGALAVDDTEGTLTPAPGTNPLNTAGSCQDVVSGSGVLLTIYYIDPNNQPSGSTLELYDGTTGMSVCSSSRILYSSGQIGAGFVYHDAPIKFTQGLEYKLVSGTAPTSPDGFRFRVLP